MASISQSVGRGGRNIRNDVALVQTKLAAAGCNPGPPDGVCGSHTIAAIIAFQARFLPRPDGLITPSGPTWQRLDAGTPAPPPAPGTSSFTSTIPRPIHGQFNVGVTAVSNNAMKAMFGEPRLSYSPDCQPLTNDKLKRHVLRSVPVGAFCVDGLGPAIESLQHVFRDIRRELPALHDRIGTAGMLCCRYQRGSSTAISNHSWGTAIDLTIDRVLDRPGDNKVQVGLAMIAPIFNRHGWYWGATFHREDAMHFEVGLALAQTIKSRLT
jgi:hypothetical protein